MKFGVIALALVILPFLILTYGNKLISDYQYRVLDISRDASVGIIFESSDPRMQKIESSGNLRFYVNLVAHIVAIVGASFAVIGLRKKGWLIKVLSILALLLFAFYIFRVVLILLFSPLSSF